MHSIKIIAKFDKNKNMKELLQSAISYSEEITSINDDNIDIFMLNYLFNNDLVKSVDYENGKITICTSESMINVILSKEGVEKLGNTNFVLIYK